MGLHGPAELAEVFLSGLLRRSAGTSSTADDESAPYVFAAGIRDVLHSTLTRVEALSVLDQVGSYLVRREGGRPFPVLLENRPNESDSLTASFGRISGMLLERIGGPYAEAARQLHTGTLTGPGPHAGIRLRFRRCSGEEVETRAWADDAGVPAGEFLTARRVWLWDGTELRQHRPASGDPRQDAYIRLDNEIRAGHRLHAAAEWEGYPPEVTRLYGYEATSADPYALFELYRGDEALREAGPYLYGDSFDEFLTGLLTGLCWLAGAGIAHRAISPDTVLWDSHTGKIQITDFSRSAPFGSARTPVTGSWSWVPRESRPDTCYGRVGSTDDIWAAVRLMYFVRSRGQDLDDISKLAQYGLAQLFNGLIENAFGPPESRPTARELVEQGIRRPHILPSRPDRSRRLVQGRASFLDTRARKHPSASVPPGFWDDIEWMSGHRVTDDPQGGTG